MIVIKIVSWFVFSRFLIHCESWVHSNSFKSSSQASRFKSVLQPDVFWKTSSKQLQWHDRLFATQTTEVSEDVQQMVALEEGNSSPSPSRIPNNGQRARTRGTGSIVNEKIMNIFSNHNGSNVNYILDLNILLTEHKKDFNLVHVATLLHRSARIRFPIETCVPLNLLTEIIDSNSTFRPPRANEIAQIIYGLRLMSLEDTVGVIDLIRAVKSKLRQCKEVFMGREIALSLYGLQRFSSSNYEVRSLLILLAEKFKESDAKLNGQEISNSLFGLRKMTSDSPEVLAILRILAKKIEASETVMNAQAVSNALNGLQGMSSNASECIAVVKALTPKVRACANIPFNALSVGCALMGLRSMSAERIEVQELLDALLEKFDMSNDFNEVSLVSAFNGLRLMSDSFPSVRRLLHKLSLVLECSQSVKDLSPQAVGHLLAGLRSMTGKSKELRAVVAVVAFKMLSNPRTASTQEFTSHDVGLSLGGLQSIDSKSCPEVLIILEKIAKRLTSTSSSQLQVLQSRHAAFALYGLRSLTREDLPEVKAILAVLASRIAPPPNTKGPKRSQGVGYIGEPFNPQLLSMAMMGLRGASTKVYEVCSVLRALTPHISAPQTGRLDGQAVGTMLFCLQGMSADNVEVRAFLSAMATAMQGDLLMMGSSGGVESLADGLMDGGKKRWVKGSKWVRSAETEFSGLQVGYVDMNPQELCNAIYGLQGMDSKYVEVQAVIKQINRRLAKRQARRAAVGSMDVMSFTAQGMGNALSGLQSMSFLDSEEISIMLGYLADEVEACKEVMRAQDLANAIFGLQGMTNECEEVRAVIAALVVKMRESEEVFTARDIGYALTGLNGMQQYLHTEVDEMIEELHYKVAASEYGGQMNVLFLQFGKSIRVKIGDAIVTNLENVAKSLKTPKSKNKTLKVE